MAQHRHHLRPVMDFVEQQLGCDSAGRGLHAALPAFRRPPVFHRPIPIGFFFQRPRRPAGEISPRLLQWSQSGPGEWPERRTLLGSRAAAEHRRVPPLGVRDMNQCGPNRPVPEWECPCVLRMRESAHAFEHARPRFDEIRVLVSGVDRPPRHAQPFRAIPAGPSS